MGAPSNPDRSNCGACEATCDFCALEAERDRLRAENEALKAEVMCRQQEIGALLEPVRKLVEGRINPTDRPRGWHSEFSEAGQRTVWLTRAEWEKYRDLLGSLASDESHPTPEEGR